MRAVIQRVSAARVRVADEIVGEIGLGLVVFVGVTATDGAADVGYLAEKTPRLRLFPGAEGKHFDRSALDLGAGLLVISQFTLYAETRKGRRPSFAAAAPSELAEPLIGLFAAKLRMTGLPVETGRFGAIMQVELANEGPVTIILDSADRERSRRAVESRAQGPDPPARDD